MTDHGTPRPHLPDPQHDRHVSFPDDAPDDRSPVGSLPPEAWAPRPSVPPTTTPSLGRPSVPASVAVPARRPGVRRRSRNRGAGLIVPLVVVPLFFGIVNGGASGSGSADDGAYSVELGGVVVLPIADSSSIAGPLPRDTQVHAVPPATTQLRVEVVTAGKDTAQVELIGSDGAYENSYEETLPFGRIASHSGAQSASIDVLATSSSGTAELQCRIYAGPVLVALSTSTSSVSCSASW